MIAVIEITTWQKFESMNFAAQYFKISPAAVKKSAEENISVKVPNSTKVVKFRYKCKQIRKASTSFTTDAPVFPYGKYKNQPIHRSNDLNYLLWLQSLNNLNRKANDAVNHRIRKLRGWI